MITLMLPARLYMLRTPERDEFEPTYYSASVNAEYSYDTSPYTSATTAGTEYSYEPSYYSTATVASTAYTYGSSSYTTPTTEAYPGDTNKVYCNWPSCSQTFGSINDRDRHFRTVHSNNGERPYKCLREGCPAGVTSWTNPEKPRAHNNRWHGPYECPEPGCSRGFPHGFGSQGELDEHRTSAYGYLSKFSPVSSRAYRLDPTSESEPMGKEKAVLSDFGAYNTVETEQ